MPTSNHSYNDAKSPQCAVAIDTVAHSHPPPQTQYYGRARSATSSASSLPAEQVHPCVQRTGSNTPSSLASSLTPPSLDSPKQAKRHLSPSSAPLAPPDTGRNLYTARRSSQESAKSHQSTVQPYVDVTRFGHHASQPLDTVYQVAMLPPPSPQNTAMPFDHAQIEAAGRDRYERHPGFAQTNERTIPDNGPQRPFMPPVQENQRAWQQSRGYTEAENDHFQSLSAIEIVDTLFSWAHTFAHNCMLRTRRYQASQSLSGLSILLISVVTTGLFAYRAYITSKWQSLYHFYNFCQRTDSYNVQYEKCQQQLKIPLPPPPYGIPSHPKIPPQSSRYDSPPASPLWDWHGFLFCMMIALFVQIVGLLVWDAVVQQVKSSRSLYPQNRYPGIWPAQHKSPDAFEPSPARLGPNIQHSSPQPRKVTLEKTGSHEIHWKDPRANANDRGIFGSPGQTAKQRYRLPETNEELYRTTSWKPQDNLTTLAPDSHTDADLNTINDLDSRDPLDVDLPRSLKIADSSSFNTRKTAIKSRRLARAGTMDTSGSGGSLSTARATETIDSFVDQKPDPAWDNSQKGSPVDSGKEPLQERPRGAIMGHIAVAMAQSGSVLAATAGGAIGKRILVQRVENQGDMLHNIISGGIARMTTRDEEALERDRNAYVAGTASIQEKDDADVRKRRKNSTLTRSPDWQDSDRRASASSKAAPRWRSISTTQE